MSAALLPSRTGHTFMGETKVEFDGALSVLTTRDHGYRSAHRDHAARHFGTHALWQMNHVSWLNSDGVRVVLTRWQPATVWTGKVGA
jgi:hypothetical protein